MPSNWLYYSSFGVEFLNFCIPFYVNHLLNKSLLKSHPILESVSSPYVSFVVQKVFKFGKNFFLPIIVLFPELVIQKIFTFFNIFDVYIVE